VIFGKDKKNNWRRVCWSDEIIFEIGYNGRNWWITRAPGKEYLNKNLKLLFKSRRTIVGVWSCFMDHPCCLQVTRTVSRSNA
jgi:hypothetical protein